jgi:hypothetical protein
MSEHILLALGPVAKKNSHGGGSGRYYALRLRGPSHQYRKPCLAEMRPDENLCALYIPLAHKPPIGCLS